jgi:hypothetical protein
LGDGRCKVIASHCSDVVFVRLRRALRLRVELMVLFVAEFIALDYFRACRDGGVDPLTRQVAGWPGVRIRRRRYAGRTRVRPGGGAHGSRGRVVLVGEGV